MPGPASVGSNASHPARSSIPPRCPGVRGFRWGLKLLRPLAPAFLVALWITAPASGASLALVPDHTTIAPGAVLEYELLVSDLGPEIVSAFDLAVVYDPSVLTALGASFGGLLGDVDLGRALVSVDLGTPGSIAVSELSLLSDGQLQDLQPSSFAIATLTLEAAGPGTTSIDLVPSDVTGLDGQLLEPGLESASAVVVPETRRLALLGAVLVVSAARSRIRTVVPRMRRVR